MITIKFRGKDFETGEWIFGDLIQRLGYYPAILTTYPTEEGKVGYAERAVREDTVGQFSTLRDKNGKEIYAGDIIRAGEEKILLEVRFVRGVFAFLWNGDLDDEFSCNAPTQEWAEVVGNIHDNPKMIKRK